MKLGELKEKLAYSCNILAHEGHWDNILGHVSVRIPGQDRILMKPHSFGFEEIRPQHIIVVDLNGKKVQGKYERHSEVFIHTEIYKARSDVNCVVHSHPPFATAFSSLRQPLRPISHEGNIFYDDLPLFDYTTALIRTAELGKELAKSLGKCRGVLMKNHGSTVVGESIEVATLYAVFLEKAARIQLIATASGEPSWTGDEEAKINLHEINRYAGNVSTAPDEQRPVVTSTGRACSAEGLAFGSNSSASVTPRSTPTSR